jgi:hypothetical protein
MSHSLKPMVGQWYRHLDKGQPFRVISAEKSEDLIEMQHFDGDIEEIEFAAWYDMDLERAAEPEDWTGPLDDVETDDLGYSETAMTDKDWRASLDENPSAAEAWQNETPEDERDEEKRDEDQSTEEPLDDEP